MAAKFDNLDDVNTKFVGTICYFDGQPVNVKAAGPHDTKPGEFVLHIVLPNGKGQLIELNNPLFSYKEYRLGYTNLGSYAPWYYRRPIKQYHQGLRRSQLGWQLSDNSQFIEDQFNYAKPYIAMLADKYPSLEETRVLLATNKAKVTAFHKDFALSFDVIHQDHILEYRGKKVGVSLNPQLTDYRLMDEFKFLTETLYEALG